MKKNRPAQYFRNIRELTSILLAVTGIFLVATLVYSVILCFQPTEQFFGYPHGDQYWIEPRAAQSKVGFYLTMQIPGSVLAIRENAIENCKAGYLVTAFAYQFPRLLLLFCYLYWARGIVNSICDGGTPFIEENVRRLRWIGVCWVSSWFVLTPFLSVMLALLVTGSFTLSGLPDVGNLLIGLLVLVLAQIFRYGCSLQQLSDETL